MELVIMDQKIQLPQETRKARDVMAEIDRQVEQIPYFVSYLIVDGVVVHDRFEEYLEKYLPNIKKIIVETRDFSSYIQEVLISEMHYLERALPELYRLSAELLNSPDESTWLKLGEFFDAAEWIFQLFENIDSLQNLNFYVRDYQVWNLYSQKVYMLNSQVYEMEKAFGNQDLVLIAEILDNQVLPLLEKIFSDIMKLVDIYE